MSHEQRNGGAVKIDRNGDSSEPTYALSPGIVEHIKYDSPILDSETYFPENAPSKTISSIYEDYYEMGTGTGTITTVGTAVTGSGTSFTTELDISSYIEVGGNKRAVASITDNTNLVLETAFPADITTPSAFLYGYEGIFLENPTLGQKQYWRISFSYSGKSINAAEGVILTLKNPLSGFERRLSVVLPEGITSDNFVTLDVSTYADANSLQPPIGTGTGGYQLFINSTKQSITAVIKDVARLNDRF